MVRRLIIAALAATLVVACGRKEPKTAVQQQAEKDAAAKTVRDNPVYGDQVKALDKAKETAAKADEAAKKTQDAINAIEKKE